jgi:hypothetical protein
MSNINGFGGVGPLFGKNPISKPSTQATDNKAPVFNKSALNGDSFELSTSPLGLPKEGLVSQVVKDIQKKPISELTQGWNASTVETLKKAPQEFPPIEGSVGG